MSAHDTETTEEDRFLRLLDDEGARWRAGYQPPGLDDAVRRLEGMNRSRHISWWRPVAAAAAVLVIIGGIIGVAVGRHLNGTHTDDSPSATTGAASSSAAWSGSTLTKLPAGFVPVSGVVQGSAAETLATLASGERHSLLLQRAWFRTRSGPNVGTRSDVIELRVYDVYPESSRQPFVEASPSQGAGPAYTRDTSTVRGRVAWVSTPLYRGGVAPITVSWTEEGQVIQVTYTVLTNGDLTASPLIPDEVLSVARTFTGPATSVATPRGTSPLPASVPVAPGSSLPLQEVRSFTARRGTDDGHLLVSLRGGPSSSPKTSTQCMPYERAVLTGTSDTTVTIAVGVYAPAPMGSSVSCIAKAYANREVSIALDGPLGGRTVIDGSTGEPVSPPVR